MRRELVAQMKLTAYLVYRNADQTEGRGPMVIDSFWTDKAKAIAYMDRQHGVMGVPPPTGGWSSQKYGDWELREVVSVDHVEPFRAGLDEVRWAVGCV